MKALVYHGPGQRSWDSVADPMIIDPTDAIVRIDTSTICGTDLHILKGDVPETAPGTILAMRRSAPSWRWSAVTTVPPGTGCWSPASPRAGAVASAGKPVTASAWVAAAGSSAT